MESGVIPAWSSRCAILIEKIPLPVKVGDRFHGKVFLAADTHEELCPTDFE
jgi:hypothetical protein